MDYERFEALQTRGKQYHKTPMATASLQRFWVPSMPNRPPLASSFLQHDEPRDQVMKSLLTAFEWTPDGSEEYRRAAIGDPPGTATAPTTPITRASSKNAGTAAAGGGKPQVDGLGARSSSKSRRLFDKFGSPGRVSPLGVLGATAGGGTGDPSAPRRRATHAGVVESGEPGLRLNLLHFRPQEFMDPDTAAQVSYGSVLLWRLVERVTW